MTAEELKAKREANEVPFKIVGWLSEPQQVEIYEEKGEIVRILECEAMLEDEYGVYTARIRTTAELLDNSGPGLPWNIPWTVKEADLDEDDDEEEKH